VQQHVGHILLSNVALEALSMPGRGFEHQTKGFTNCLVMPRRPI